MGSFASLEQEDLPTPDVAVAKRKCSEFTERTKRSRQSITTDDAIRLLHHTLKENMLAKATVQHIMRIHRDDGAAPGVSKTMISEDVKGISCIPFTVPDTTTEYPDSGGYLFSILRLYSGYDHDSLRKTTFIQPYSLFHAFSPNCDLQNDSLDMVFRQALKELAMDTILLPFDDEKAMTIWNPIYICARYLELVLLTKIRTHYINTCNEDVLLYFTSRPTPNGMKLSPLIEKSTCKSYIWKLIDRYRLKPQTFEKTLTEPFDVLRMRLWTDRNSQIDTNFKIQNAMHRIFEDCLSLRGPLSRDLSNIYYDSLKPFIRSKFMAECMKASELMAWLCFGLATNSIDGIYHTLYAYKMISGIELDRIGPYVLWNFPLATTYHREFHCSKNNII